MREQNVIQIITVTNPLALGQSSSAMLGIAAQSGRGVGTAAEYFRDLEEVVYAMRVMGRFDLLVEVVVYSPISLRIFLDKHCYESGLVAAVGPTIALGLYKSLDKREIPMSKDSLSTWPLTLWPSLPQLKRQSSAPRKRSFFYSRNSN